MTAIAGHESRQRPARPRRRAGRAVRAGRPARPRRRAGRARSWVGQASVELVALLPRSCVGQASVELVALLPLLLVIALVVFSAIAAHSADEQAGAAAEAAAIALIQGGDPRAAALAALPAAVRPRATITIDDRRVHVHVRPRLPLPGLAELLAGDVGTDAGRAAP